MSKLDTGSGIPSVIDNTEHKLADVLNELLRRFEGRSLDVATAYFTVQGFRLIREGLEHVGSFRLLLGWEPGQGADLGVRPHDVVSRCLQQDVSKLKLTEKNIHLIEELIRFLRGDKVSIRLVTGGFLHAKCYLLYGDMPQGSEIRFDRLRPIVGIVGSSNLTGPGLTSNRELNTCLQVASELTRIDDKQQVEDKASEPAARTITQLVQWFDREWGEAEDFKGQLVQLLDDSKFGEREYTPYQVYMKALFEYFRDQLQVEQREGVRSAVDLTEFEEDAVEKARKILQRYDGVMVADPVGYGKTWIGKKLLEDYAYHLRQKALVICPASLKPMWGRELREATIPATLLSQEIIGREEFDAQEYADSDVILIDESHNFRSSESNRYLNLNSLIAMNGGRGRAGERKKIVLVTATPLNNDVLDLYNQICLFTLGDRTYFSAAGIGDLRRYFLDIRRSQNGTGSAALFNLLEEVVVRRTRKHIQENYPDATIAGKRIHWPERKLHTMRYNLEATYEGIYDRIVSAVEGLNLAHYNLESYKKPEVKVDAFEKGRESALVGIFKTRYLKRLESSVAAFRISMERALSFVRTFESYLDQGKVLDSANFRKALSYLSVEDEEDDVTGRSRADEIDASRAARDIIDSLEELNADDYEIPALTAALRQDADTFAEILGSVQDISPERDAKLLRLKEFFAGELRAKKVLLFTYYKDTARYLYAQLAGDANKQWLEDVGNPKIRRMDSGTAPKDRGKAIAEFAPKSNKKPEWAGTDREIDIMISTDVLSEGQNLQDCGHVMNYDLHWNPTRMVQRTGRIDRIGTEFDELHVYNVFPDKGLEHLLRIVETLTRKIEAIDKAGLMDVSVLGETVHPQSFNAIKRIGDEDASIFEEQESLAELASSEFLLQSLRQLIKGGGQEVLENLPEGIHSGLRRRGCRGVFFYFIAAKEPDGQRYHYWRYYDTRTGEIEDNRFVIANHIQCDRDTKRVVGDCDIFDVQEKVIQDILKSVDRQRTLEEAPKRLEPVQKTAAAILLENLNHPDLDREQCLSLMGVLNQSLPLIANRILRKALKRLKEDDDTVAFVSEIAVVRQFAPSSSAANSRAQMTISRENLHLVCFDYVWS